METRTATTQKNSTSSFAAYLGKRKVKAQLIKNIDEHVSRALMDTGHAEIGCISRYFNDLSNVTIYSGFQPLLACLKSSGPINEYAVKNNTVAFQHWLDFALVMALDDLFDSNGDIKNDVYVALNQQTILDQLTERYGLDEIKNKLLFSYLLMLGELATPKVLLSSSLEDITEEKPGKQAVPVFSKALSTLQETIPDVNNDNITALNARLAMALTQPRFEPQQLQGSIQQHFQTHRARKEMRHPVGNTLLSGIKNMGDVLAWAGQAIIYGVKLLISCNDPAVEGAYPPASIKPKPIRLPQTSINTAQEDIEMTTPKPVSRENKQKQKLEGSGEYSLGTLSFLAEPMQVRDRTSQDGRPKPAYRPF